MESRTHEYLDIKAVCPNCHNTVNMLGVVIDFKLYIHKFECLRCDILINKKISIRKEVK